jgi:fibronectin-binding autotransporter adhesin
MTSPAIRWRVIAAQLAALMVLAASAPAATITWDADATTGEVTDGAGAWLGTNQWWNGTSHVTWTSGDDAVFGVGGTGGAVTLSAPTTAGSLTFDPFTGTYTLGTAGQALTLGSGGLSMNAGAGAVTLVSPVTLGAAQTWTNNSASLLTTSATMTNGGHLLSVAGNGNASLAAISGAGGLAKSGGGTLSLVGANTYTGGTTVSGGTLTLANGQVSGSFNGVIRGSITVSGGATVNATQSWSLGAGGPNSAQPTTQSVTDITLTGGTLNITTATTKGGMSPTTITMTGGSLTGDSVQWYYGNSSTVSLVTNASATTSTVSAPVVLRLNKTAGAGSLTFDVAAGTAPDGVDLLVSGAISNATDEGGGGRIVKSGAGTLRMTAINSYTQGTTVQAGTLSLGNGGANGVIRGSLAIEPGARVVASAEGWSLGYGGTRPGATFAGNSVTAITINGGTLEFTNGLVGAGLAASEITLTGGTIAGASFGWINSNTLTPTLRTLASGSRSTLEGGISLRLSSAGTLSFDVASGSTADGIDLLVSGPISQPTTGDNIGGAIAKAGPGTLVLAGANTATGGVVVNGGTLAVQGSMAANQNYTISNGTLRTAATAFNVLGLNWTSGTMTLNPGGVLSADNASSNAHNVFNVVLAGGELAAGAGSVSPAFANWYINGGITANGETTSTISASLGRTGVSGAALSMTVAAGSTLNVTGPIVNIVGANPLTKSGAGTLVLAAANTYTGATTVSAGTLQVGGGGTSGTLGGATSAIDVASDATLAFNRSDAYGGSFTRAISGAGGLRVDAGTLALAAANTYAGGTTIAGGTLRLTAAGLLGSGSYAGGITNSGRFEHAGTLDQLVSGDISGAGDILVTGPGSLSLSGSNSYAGGTAVNGGILVYRVPAAQPATGSTVVADGAGLALGVGAGLYSLADFETLHATGSLPNVTLSTAALAGVDTTAGDVSVATALGGTRGLAKTGSGTLTLTGANSYTGPTRIVAGTLQVGSGSTTGTLGSGAVTNNARLSFNRSNPLTVANLISGTGSVVQQGAGTLTLTAINTYTGGTVVEAGTLSLGNGAANGVIRGSLSIQPGARAIASAQGWSLGYGGTRAGATYPGNSVTVITIDGGTLEFTNGQSGAGLAASEITLTGGTIAGASFGWINSNTLTPTLRTLASGSRSTLQGGISLRLATGTLSFNVASGSTTDGIDLLVSGPITTATTGDNAGGSVVKTGAGTLSLAAANTFTGGTSITGGRLEVGPTGSLTATSGITLAGGELRYNSATALARALTLTAGTISGTGTIATPVSVATGGVLSPGNSPGTQAYSQGLTWNGGGTYLWEVNALSGTAGTNWDLLNISGGTFDLSGLSAGSRFILDLTTLTAADLPGPLAVPFDGGASAFPIASYATLSSPLGTAALTDLTSLFDLRLDNWAAPKPGLGDISVRINAAADGIELIVVPEPATAVGGLVAVGLAAWRLRRRGPRKSS